jgi:hypothetical protein
MWAAMAPALHSLAKHYGTDPWTIAHKWTLGRYDFNLFILQRALEEEARALERARRTRNG